MNEKYPIDSKKIRHLNKTHPYSGIEHEYNRYRENGKVTPKEDHLYLFFISVSDKNGMSYYSGKKIQKYVGIGWTTFVRAMEKLSNLGLIKYEKKEDHVAVQVLQVPDWDIAKHRFVEIKINLSPAEIADKLKTFDVAINDPQQAQFKNFLITQRAEFLKSLPDRSKTVSEKSRS
jgi:hypothetical protein